MRKDWIYIRNNIKVDDLGPVLSFVGKLEIPNCPEFRWRSFATARRFTAGRDQCNPGYSSVCA